MIFDRSYTVSVSMLLQLYYRSEFSSDVSVLVGDPRCRLIAPSFVATTLIDTMRTEGVIVPKPDLKRVRDVVAHMINKKINERPVEFLDVTSYITHAVELCFEYSLESLNDGIYFAISIQNKAPILTINNDVVEKYQSNQYLKKHIFHLHNIPYQRSRET